MNIPHGTDRVQTIDRRASGDSSVDAIVAALRGDQVALVRNVAARQADEIMSEVAAALDLGIQLESQAAFAGIHGHRRNVGRFFMTVNRRSEFEIVMPHSEGSRLQNIQLASFYCHQNTTDGGVSLLLNCDQDSPVWYSMRELVTRIDPSSRPLTASEKALARAKFMVEGFPEADDRVLQEVPSEIAGVRFLWVLTPLRRSFSKIQQREVFTYWDSVASLDLDGLKECLKLMGSLDLLREPADGPRIDHGDPVYRRTLWSSGAAYQDLFKAVVVRKLEPGDLIIQNNLTWTHAASNWTPGSGTRRLIAAFA